MHISVQWGSDLYNNNFSFFKRRRWYNIIICMQRYCDQIRSVMGIEVGDIFKVMFPVYLEKNCHWIYEDIILITHDLQPYFHEQVLKSVESKFVICFDEAFSKISKKGQTDLFMRYFNNVTYQVWSRYFSRRELG